MHGDAMDWEAARSGLFGFVVVVVVFSLNKPIVRQLPKGGVVKVKDILFYVNVQGIYLGWIEAWERGWNTEPLFLSPITFI